MVAVINEAGGTNVVATPLDESDPLAPITRATKDAALATMTVADAIKLTGSEIIRLDAQAAPSIFASQHPRLRVRFLILNVITAGAATLTIGTAQYPFQLDANALVILPFPLVVERGLDMAFAAADGRAYLIGDPE